MMKTAVTKTVVMKNQNSSSVLTKICFEMECVLDLDFKTSWCND